MSEPDAHDPLAALNDPLGGAPGLSALAVPPPLHLPVGSVRALVTLAVLGTVWAQLLLGRPEDEAVKVTLLLVLGYYFGARSGATAADALAGAEAGRRHPLFLPRGSVRLLITLGFLGVAWKLHEDGRLAAGPPPMLILAATFLAGSFAKALAAFLRDRVLGQGTGLLGHLLAGGTLLVVGGYCGAVLLEAQGHLPAQASSVFLGVVGFYLGKR